MESEIAKQQHRIDKILSPQFAKNTHLVLELRREIEKSVLVRQLKAQMLALRSTIAERDATIEAMQKSTGATHLLELTAEKEEYFQEVHRLHKVLAQKEKELEKERQSHAWEKTGTVNVEGRSHPTVTRPGLFLIEWIPSCRRSEGRDRPPVPRLSTGPGPTGGAGGL